MIKTTKQAFDLINEDGRLDEEFVVSPGYRFDERYNVKCLLDMFDAPTRRGLVKAGEGVDYERVAEVISNSKLFKAYKALDLSDKHIVNNGVLKTNDFDSEVLNGIPSRRACANKMVCITSTEQLQTMVDAGVVPVDSLNDQFVFTPAAALYQDVDFNKLTKPGSDEPLPIRLDYSTIVDCQLNNLCQVAWSEVYGGELANDCKVAQTHFSGMSESKPCLIGANARLIDCSAEGNVVVGPDSIVFSAGRNPFEGVTFENDCWLIGGVYKHNKYGQDIKADVPTADVLKGAFGSEYMAKRTSGRMYWHLSPLTSAEDLEGSTTIILPKSVDDIDHMLQYTDSANRELKRGIIGRHVAMKITGEDGQPRAFHGAGPDIRAAFRTNNLNYQSNRLNEILESSRDVVESYLQERFKDYFGIVNEQDMFDGAGGEPIYKNKALIAKVRSSIEHGFAETLLHSRSHKDLSNDHVFATKMVDMIKQDVGDALNVEPEHIKERGYQFKFNMESAKRLLREIIDEVPDLHKFNLIKLEQEAEIRTLSSEIEHDINEGLSYEDIQAQLAGTWVEPVDQSPIEMVATANGNDSQLDWLSMLEAQKMENDDEAQPDAGPAPSMG